MTKYRKNGSYYEYTRAYTGLSGIRAGGADGFIECIENLYRDYSSSGGRLLESIPGYRCLSKLPKKIHAIYPLAKRDGGEELIIHIDGSLVMLNPENPSSVAVLCYLEGSKSTAFRFGDFLYVFLSGQMLRISEGGVCKVIGPDRVLAPYSPLLYYDGNSYEQRNLLTPSAREKRRIYSSERFSYGNPEIKYRIEDTVLNYCSVIGAQDSLEGELYIPGYTTIGGVEYKVVEVVDNAFALNTKITEVKLGEGIERIGKFAFRGNTSLKKVITPRSLRLIDNAAFQDCENLSEVYLSGGLEFIGLSLFNFCNKLSTIYYSLDDEHLEMVENQELLRAYEIIFGRESLECRVAIPICSEPTLVEDVLIDGESTEFALQQAEGKISAVLLDLENPWALDGHEVEIHLRIADKPSTFGSGADRAPVSGWEAITGCTVSEKFDGRLFLSGNPRLPGAVFFSSEGVDGTEEPLYFGEYNYFNDSRGESRIISMLAVRDSLAIFKDRDDGTGSIIYHYGNSTEDGMLPRIYPVSSIHSELCAIGPSRSFFDDPVFISPIGVCGIEHKSLEYERSISKRSSNVNYYLLSEKLDQADIFEWLGYLGVAVNGNIYLADSRDTTTVEGRKEYEWYMIKGVGRWDNQAPVYKYSANSAYDIKTHSRVDEEVSETVYSEQYGTSDGENELMYYTLEKDEKYAVCKTGEYRGGVFSPGRCFTSADGVHLYFTASDGYLYTFNNDMRGVAPDRIRLAEGFDAEEYERTMGKQIHPDFYDFDGRAVRYALRTRLDNCGVPHLAKDSVKGSLIAKIKSFTKASLSLEVATDSGGYREIVEFSPSVLSFHDLDFSSLGFAVLESYTLPFNEKEKNWVDKSISIYTERFQSPIGIENIAFRYRLRGNIKKK